MKTPKSKAEKTDEKLIDKAISVYYEACAYHRVNRRKPIPDFTKVYPASIVLKDEHGEIATVTRGKRQLYFAINGITHAQDI